MPIDAVETSLSEDLTRALSAMDSPVSARLLSPELDLDSVSLPPLDDFSSVEEALSCSLGDLSDLGALASLDPLPSDLSLSHTLSPAASPILSPRATPSHSSVSSHSLPSLHDAPPSPSPSPPPVCCPDVRAALHEVSARLKSAAAESASLRARVADLVRENRGLQSSLATARAAPPAQSPNAMLLGLAHVSAEAASTLAAALNIGGASPSRGAAPLVGKKRKRAAAGKTLACLVLMCGFFFGSPSVLNSADADRTDANLPALWGGSSAPASSGKALAQSRAVAPPVRPSHCLRTLEQLAPPEMPAVAPPTDSAADADEDDEDDEEQIVARNAVVAQHEDGDDESMEPPQKRRATQFSYVMCRNSSAALEHVSACQRKQNAGHKCGPPHSISLIMPASALAGDDTSAASAADEDYAEVLCNIVSVSRIPSSSGGGSADPRKRPAPGGGVSGVAAVHAAMGASARFGRVVGSVREEVVGT